MCFAKIFYTNALWQSLATSYFVFNFYNAVSSSKYWYLTNYSTHTLPPAYIRYYSGISHKNPPLFLNNKSGGITHDTATFALALKIYQKSETIPIETGFRLSLSGADGGTWTHTRSPPQDFESCASAIPPHPPIYCDRGLSLLETINILPSF